VVIELRTDLQLSKPEATAHQEGYTCLETTIWWEDSIFSRQYSLRLSPPCLEISNLVTSLKAAATVYTHNEMSPVHKSRSSFPY